MFGAYGALVPSMPQFLGSVRQSFDAMAMESSFLGPVFHRIVAVSAGLVAVLPLASAGR